MFKGAKNMVSYFGVNTAAADHTHCAPSKSTQKATSLMH